MEKKLGIFLFVFMTSVTIFHKSVAQNNTTLLHPSSEGQKSEIGFAGQGVGRFMFVFGCSRRDCVFLYFSGSGGHPLSLAF